MRTRVALAPALALLLPLAAALPARAEDATAVVLSRLLERNKTLVGFEARVRQRKAIGLLDEEIVSTGRMAYRAGHFRLDIDDPRPSATVVDASGLRVYIPALSQLEVYDFPGAQAVAALFPLYGQGRAELTAMYALSLRDGPAEEKEATHLLVLVPKPERMRRAVREIHVWVDRASLDPRRVRYFDASGDSVTLEFEAVVPDPPLDDARFRLDVPEGTRVVRPLRGLPF